MEMVSPVRNVDPISAHCYTQPRLNSDFSTISHAHPLSTQSSPSTTREQRVRALIARQPIHVSLHGLSCERAATVSDILTPKIRRSPFNGEGMFTTFSSSDIRI